MKKALYIYTDTPLHAGTGTGLGAVDMPIQREKHTDYPIIQASGVKGALRDTTELALDDENTIKAVFGRASGEAGEDHAGAISPSDARILLFPVRALKGVFVWITSPTVLSRFVQDIGGGDAPKMPAPFGDDEALVANDDITINGRVMLEEYAYKAKQDERAAAWADYLAKNALPENGYDFWKTRLKTHLAILSDDDFRDFVKYGTDIVTRIHLDDVKKTVQDGQLFTQELLPGDSLLYSIVVITKSRNGGKLSADNVFATLKNGVGSSIQIGADETVGRGRVRLTWGEAK